MYMGSVHACINPSRISCTDGLYYSDCCDIRYGQMLLVVMSCTYSSDMWNLYISIVLVSFHSLHSYISFGVKMQT